jgi:hypothetical protein
VEVLAEESVNVADGGTVPEAGDPENATPGTEAPPGVVIRMRRKHAQRIGMIVKKTVNTGIPARALSIILLPGTNCSPRIVWLSG